MLAGSNSFLTAGDRSKLTAGDDCTLMAGDRSKLTAGKNSVLTAGANSRLIGSLGSTLTGGEDSVLIFRCWDGKRYTNIIAKTGEEGVEADTAYQVDDDTNVVEKFDYPFDTIMPDQDGGPASAEDHAPDAHAPH
ncbi:hypothetical protein IXO651_021690 [Xanthomonas oryzae pv. oryzae]|nr:hypothetical protein EBA18_22445 [Xanthomonas oryzae pv. oryzae]QBO04610.1 hypothetical protein EBA21_22585 [Xanthomonas oryzae pv. oryzae]UXW37209.1 hypothetical protein IXO651_021690 [Xanthomonas oryzae pv. oryzae]UXW44557.1 hypothetical protein IXO685_0013540 [Xanthomonas oryzae pv. oryzae]